MDFDSGSILKRNLLYNFKKIPNEEILDIFKLIIAN